MCNPSCEPDLKDLQRWNIYPHSLDTAGPVPIRTSQDFFSCIQPIRYFNDIRRLFLIFQQQSKCLILPASTWYLDLRTRRLSQPKSHLVSLAQQMIGHCIQLLTFDRDWERYFEVPKLPPVSTRICSWWWSDNTSKMYFFTSAPLISMADNER